jgi:hypothetical protein
VEIVGKSHARIGGYADADDFLDVGWIEVFGGLPGIAAGNEEIYTGSQAAAQKNFLRTQSCRREQQQKQKTEDSGPPVLGAE